MTLNEETPREESQRESISLLNETNIKEQNNQGIISTSKMKDENKNENVDNKPKPPKLNFEESLKNVNENQNRAHSKSSRSPETKASKQKTAALNLSDISNANNQSLSSTARNNPKSTKKVTLHLGDCIKDITKVLSNTLSESSQTKKEKAEKEQSSTLNLGDSLKGVTQVLHKSIEESSQSKDQQKDKKQTSTFNLGDSLKGITQVLHQSIKESSQSKDQQKDKKQTSTLNLGDALNDVTEILHQSISKSSQNKAEKSEPLTLGDPLADATKAIHESIRTYSTDEKSSINSSENTSGEEEHPKQVIMNVLETAVQALDNSIQKQSNKENKSEELEEPKDLEKEQEKGQLEQYIEDNILITMVSSPHKSTAGTQTDQTLYDDEENNVVEEEEEVVEEKDDLPPIIVSKYSDEELHEALQKQIATHQLPPYEMREAIIDYARKQSIFKLMEEDYDKASKIDEAVAANLQSLRDDHHSIEADMLNSHLKNRLVEAERSKSSLQDEWKQRIRSFKENEQNELFKINERHEQERRIFENTWSQASVLMPFSKPSSTLLQLRSMQKAFALSHDFANARQLKITAERKQKEESIEASKKAARSMRKQYIELINRQQNEIACFNENCNRKLGKLEQQRDSELKINENVRSQLASRVNKSRGIKRPMVLIPSPPKVDKKSTSLAALTGQMTHRTRSQFANYRQSVDMKMLDVRIDDLHSIVKPLTPASQSNQKSSKNQKKSKESKKY